MSHRAGGQRPYATDGSSSTPVAHRRIVLAQTKCDSSRSTNGQRRHRHCTIAAVISVLNPPQPHSVRRREDFCACAPLRREPRVNRSRQSPQVKFALVRRRTHRRHCSRRVARLALHQHESKENNTQRKTNTRQAAIKHRAHHHRCRCRCRRRDPWPPAATGPQAPSVNRKVSTSHTVISDKIKQRTTAAHILHTKKSAQRIPRCCGAGWLRYERHSRVWRAAAVTDATKMRYCH